MPVCSLDSRYCNSSIPVWTPRILVILVVNVIIYSDQNIQKKKSNQILEIPVDSRIPGISGGMEECNVLRRRGTGK